MCGLGCPPMQLTRQRTMPQRQYYFDQTRNPRRRFQMADIGLHRADQQRLPGAAPLRPSTAPQRRRLDRISQRCPRAMRLYISHSTGSHPALPAAPDAAPPSCARPVRNRQARCSHRRGLLPTRGSPPKPDPHNATASRNRFKINYPAAFATDKPVLPRKRFALTVRTQTCQFATPRSGPSGIDDDIYTPGDGKVAFRLA